MFRAQKISRTVQGSQGQEQDEGGQSFRLVSSNLSCFWINQKVPLILNLGASDNFFFHNNIAPMINNVSKVPIYNSTMEIHIKRRVQLYH